MRHDNWRIGALLLGEQGSGKTTRERIWSDDLISWTRYNSYALDTCLVFDRLGEPAWDGAGPVVDSIGAFNEACFELSLELGLEHEALPRRVVVRAGMDPKAYRPFLNFAVDQGNVLLVIPEASDWFPSHKGQWPVNRIRGDITLDTLLRMGRHVPNRDGELKHIHFITETQEAKGISPILRNQSNFVACGAIEGENNLTWVRHNFGRDSRELVERVQNLGSHEWITLRDKLGGGVPRPRLNSI